MLPSRPRLRRRLQLSLASIGALSLAAVGSAFVAPQKEKEPERPNVLFIISDDLNSTAISSYGSKVSQTPHIDSLAAQGARFTRAYCQFPVCGPSRASFMSGYYPHATRVFGYTSGREAIGDRATWAEHFKNAGYYTARVSKIFHMGVPKQIEDGVDGADDPRSWTQRYNSKGPEWKAPGKGELLEGNPDHDRKMFGRNNFAYVMAKGNDLVHSDGKTAKKAIEILRKRAKKKQPFFLAVGFVRPHVPFVAPKKYFKPYPFDDMLLPGSTDAWEVTPEDWDDIPKAGINYKTSKNMKMDVGQRRASIASYYASVAYVDALVGKLLKALDDLKLADSTIVIFTSDHGFHLGEHDFWAKVSLHEESVHVPLIIRMPGKQPVVCDGFTELLDLYPTLAEACGLELPERLQGKSVLGALDDPEFEVRDTAFCVNGKNKGFLLRDERWAYIQYAENASAGVELYDMQADPKQLTNVARAQENAAVVADFRERLTGKLAQVRTNDF